MHVGAARATRRSPAVLLIGLSAKARERLGRILKARWPKVVLGESGPGEDLAAVLRQPWQAIVLDLASLDRSQRPGGAKTHGGAAVGGGHAGRFLGSRASPARQALRQMRRQRPRVLTVGLTDKAGLARARRLSGLGLDCCMLRDDLGALVTLIDRELSLVALRHGLAERDERLAEVERRYARVLDSYQDVYYLASLDGVLLGVSPSVERRAGYKVEELVGRDVREVYARPEDRERFMSELLGSGELENYELRVRTKSGTERDTLLNARLLRDEQGRPELIEGVLRDITEWKAMEAELRQSEESYRLFVENASDVIFWMDHDGRILFINEVGARYFGRAARDLVGTRMGEWFPGPHAAHQMRSVREVLESGQGRTIEAETVIQGESRWFSTDIRPVRDLSGAVVRVQAIARDITDKVRTSAELRDASDFINGIVDSLADPIFVKDSLHRFVLVNKALCAMVGREREEMLGRKDEDFFPQDQVAVFLEKDEEVLRTGHENTNEELLRDADGLSRVIVTKKTRYQRTSGERFIVGVIRDITEAKEADRERELLIGKLQDALANIKTLRGLIPVCASCKKIRNDQGYWQQVDDYVREHSEAEVSHGICQDCAAKLYPDLVKPKKNGRRGPG